LTIKKTTVDYKTLRQKVPK